MAVDPWHMWGTEVHVDMTTDTSRRSVQLVQINYHRPESWRFLLWASCGNFTGIELTVKFSLYAGIGRSVFAENDWHTFRFGTGGRKWTALALAPALDDLAATPVRPLVDTIVGQTITIGATVDADSFAIPQLRIMVGAQLAPASHIRPDWFSNSPNAFEAGQLEGK